MSGVCPVADAGFLFSGFGIKIHPDMYRRNMKKKIITIALAAMLTVIFSGCSILGINNNTSKEPLPLTNGTTTGNILNYGFSVKDGDDLIFRYMSGEAYAIGSTVRSNPDTGENNLIMEDGGLYMNLVGDMLYYCKPEGVFRADIYDPQPELILGSDVRLLQISDGVMYYIGDGTLDARTTNGEEIGFEPIENADCLNVYSGKIYYINTEDGYIYSADLDGSGSKIVIAKSVSMFCIMDDNIFYIDATTGYIVRLGLEGRLAVAIVEYTCTGFNINRSNMYYTRYINGVGTCCNADLDGGNEETLAEFGDSSWHVVCMYNTGALLAKAEDFEN